MSTSLESSSSCWLIDDSEKLEIGFDPKDFNCSHYSRIYKDSSIGEKYELGTRISFDIPDHVPNICDECRKQNGNCGVGLKCICYPKQCSKYSLTLKFQDIFFVHYPSRKSRAYGWVPRRSYIGAQETGY
ncbi:hypothetical protein C5167_003889 [Papaver somniferum]|uniref:Uncharacterized protein n=1 Tax=Papaver somniferum TaxID=3469 RepID=A0A4Y7KZQ5_PAPSO|nr:uncharacterized protein LOC113309401 isoform X1 [Papaver somniferum]RZC78783.1 hypothetical protein C5167_003889 [Papaver somniferum]